MSREMGHHAGASADAGGDVAAVIASLARQFGPGFSNGVSAILLHDALPDRFDKSCWAGWFFKPADAAFEKAHDMGLIAPWQLSAKWMFTDLGTRVSAYLLSQTTQEDTR